MTSLERPSAARRTILARMISQYGDVYLRALDWSCSCSSLVSLIRNGLDLGKPVTSAETKSSPEPNVKARTIRHRIYETEYLASHPDPESCACSRKAQREALTGAHAGRVLSRVMSRSAR